MENHLVLIFQANRFVRLQELAQFSTIKLNPLPRRQRACPSVSLDKKVMCCYLIVARIDYDFTLFEVNRQGIFENKSFSYSICVGNWCVDHFVQPGELLRQPVEPLRQPVELLRTTCRATSSTWRTNPSTCSATSSTWTTNHSLINRSNYRSLKLQWSPSLR